MTEFCHTHTHSHAHTQTSSTHTYARALANIIYTHTHAHQHTNTPTPTTTMYSRSDLSADCRIGQKNGKQRHFPKHSTIACLQHPNRYHRPHSPFKSNTFLPTLSYLPLEICRNVCITPNVNSSGEKCNDLRLSCNHRRLQE